MCHVVLDGLFRYYEANKQGIDFKQLLLTSNTWKWARPVALEVLKVREQLIYLQPEK